ncbi:MAG: sigma-54 dependent transcriptional regulator [Acidobacteriota bacterium]|jgi:DNA-binding NtrC family response regulator|nr:sigma-54 dependent transcriptional regulator [Acidobacteriota bacterium]
MDNKDIRILVVDDEDYMRDIVRQTLETAGLESEEAADGKSALEMMRRNPYNVIITDLRLPGLAGEALLEEAKALFPETIVIIMTGFGNIQSAVEVIRKGAYDYLPKPFQVDELLLRVEKGLKEQQLKTENQQLRVELHGRYQFSNLVGSSAPMQAIYNRIGLVAQKNSTVLIEGETGTGKELIAKAIHCHSLRKDQPLVSVNCGAIPANLLEDELFGHVKGAFTGAMQHRIGRFEQANHGTLFLDEVSSMPMELQVKLLRVLQEREFQRVGGSATVKVDVRIVAATNGDLRASLEKGEFREDLYYRLNVIPINVPALRQRCDDIPLLVAHFARKVCNEQKVPLKRISDEAMRQLMCFDWPGNVRQLENTVEMAVTLSGDRELLGIEDFPVARRRVKAEETVHAIEFPDDGVNFNSVVSNLEKKLILQSLEIARGNKKKAATLLHLKRTTFVEKLRRMGVDSGDPMDLMDGSDVSDSMGAEELAQEA